MIGYISIYLKVSYINSKVHQNSIRNNEKKRCIDLLKKNPHKSKEAVYDTSDLYKNKNSLN